MSDTTHMTTYQNMGMRNPAVYEARQFLEDSQVTHVRILLNDHLRLEREVLRLEAADKNAQALIATLNRIISWQVPPAPQSTSERKENELQEIPY